MSLHVLHCTAAWKLQGVYMLALLTLLLGCRHVLSCPPSCVCSVPALERLSCEGVRAPGFSFTSFTDHGFPSWVKSVSLSNSHIKYFQANEMWTRIEILDLSVNNISDFYPAMFSGLANLTFLNLNRNNISTLRYHDETILPHLTTLDLSYNNISVLNNKSFHGLPVLQTISLQGNMITMLMSNVFNNIPNLRSLDLSDNYILYVHPSTFDMSPTLTTLDLSYNELRSLPDKVVSLFHGMTEVSLAVNEWDCSCVVHDLLESLQNDSHVFLSVEYLTCHSPAALHGTRLRDLQLSEATCIKPAMLHNVTDNDGSSIERISATLMTDLMLDCPVSGVPSPAIVWESPRGRWFAQHQSYHLLYEHHIDKVKQERYYEDRRMSYVSKVSILTNGSLYLEYARGLFIGNFSCFAINPHGNISKVIYVHLHAPMEDIYTLSLFICVGCAVGFLLIGFIIGGIEMLVDKCCKSEKVKIDHSIEVVVEVEEEEDKEVFINESCKDPSLSSNHSGSPPDSGSSYMVTPYESPMKCNTPIEEDDEFRESPEFSNHIMETMEEVRWRLRHGVERKLERVRSGVQNIRDTGTLYYQNIKTSSTQYMQTIKESSSVAASRVRTGMVMGMEQVKYHVQSIKEFCGTGDMGGQTISTVSFETNVDTQRKTDIIRSHTYV